MNQLPDAKAVMRRVAWRDLVPMRVAEGAVECLHPLPWLLASWWLAAHALWPLAAGASFMFFLTALRLNHEAIHGHLGFTARGHRRVMHGLSMLMLGSNNAVAFNHLRHHRHLNTALDVEGKAGRMSGWRVLLYGPVFPLEMHRDAWVHGGAALRRRMLVDAAGNLVTIAAAFAWAPLRWHLLAMVTAQCLTAFFAVWITHHGTEDDGLHARTQRSRLVNFVTYNMFFHLEHHLFPAVPVKRLDTLANRLDHAAPEIAARAGRVL
jgi:fatty acid desaturase